MRGIFLESGEGGAGIGKYTEGDERNLPSDIARTLAKRKIFKIIEKKEVIKDGK